MEFFVPKATTKEKEIEIYQAMKNAIEKNMGAKLSDRKIQSLQYRHDGVIRSAIVGEVDPIQNEIVLAIYFEQMRNVYHVCTPNRGLLAGPTILVGGDEVIHRVEFDQ